jgi:hypothetical protein
VNLLRIRVAYILTGEGGEGERWNPAIQRSSGGFPPPLRAFPN